VPENILAPGRVARGINVYCPCVVPRSTSEPSFYSGQRASGTTRARTPSDPRLPGVHRVLSPAHPFATTASHRSERRVIYRGRYGRRVAHRVTGKPNRRPRRGGGSPIIKFNGRAIPAHAFRTRTADPGRVYRTYRTRSFGPATE